MIIVTIWKQYQKFPITFSDFPLKIKSIYLDEIYLRKNHIILQLNYNIFLYMHINSVLSIFSFFQNNGFNLQI